MATGSQSQQQQGRDKLPRDIRAPGPLRNDAVVGRILFVESRSLGSAAATGSQAPSQVAATGGGKTQGKGKGKAKGARSDAVLEITLCGGKSPADVMMFQAWEPDVRARLQGSAGVGDTVRIRRGLVVAHTDKTRFHCTSRSPMFLKALSDTTMERIEDKPEFLKYHPTTPISSLPLLAPRSLVCLAGRVVEPGNVQEVDTPDGDTGVPVAHLALRVSGDVIRVNFWRETASMVESLGKGDLTFLWGVAKQWPKDGEDSKTQVELRATARTRVLTCPEPLPDTLASTPADLSGAKIWSARLSKKIKDYADAEGTSMSLSVLEGLMASKVIRDLHRVFEVPSVFLEFGSQLTYPGCGTCLKAWREEGRTPCQCSAAQRVHLWRARLGLRDATGQVQAVCFKALESVVEVYGDVSSDAEKAPEHFGSEEIAEHLASCVAAVPFTARITVAPDGYKEAMEATVQLLTPTFSTAGVKHPLKPVVQIGQAAGACPPFHLAQTAYSEGIGMTEAEGKAYESFRALVTFADDAVGLGADGCTAREVHCVFDAGEAALKYRLEADGDGSVAQALGSAEKRSSAHVLLAWRSTEVIGVIAMLPVPVESLAAFGNFFAREVELCKDSAARGREHREGGRLPERRGGCSWNVERFLDGPRGFQ